MDENKETTYLPLEKREWVLHLSGSVNSENHKTYRKFEGIDKHWVQFRKSESYTPPPLKGKNGQFRPGDKEKWIEQVKKYMKDVMWHLKLPYQRFWSHMVYSGYSKRCFSSYLEGGVFSMPLQHIDNPDEDIKKLEQKVNFLVFLWLRRLTTFRESEKDFMEPTFFGNMLYMEEVITMHDIMKMCIVFIDRRKKLNAILHTLFAINQNYWKDLELLASNLVNFVNILELKIVKNLNEGLKIFDMVMACESDDDDDDDDTVTDSDSDVEYIEFVQHEEKSELQNGPISESVLQNRPVSESVLQNRPVSESVLQNGPISEKIKVVYFTRKKMLDEEKTGEEKEKAQRELACKIKMDPRTCRSDFDGYVLYIADFDSFDDAGDNADASDDDADANDNAADANDENWDWDWEFEKEGPRYEGEDERKVMLRRLFLEAFEHTTRENALLMNNMGLQIVALLAVFEPSCKLFHALDLERKIASIYNNGAIPLIVNLTISDAMKTTCIDGYRTLDELTTVNCVLLCEAFHRCFISSLNYPECHQIENPVESYIVLLYRCMPYKWFIRDYVVTGYIQNDFELIKTTFPDRLCTDTADLEEYIRKKVKRCYDVTDLTALKRKNKRSILKSTNKLLNRLPRRSAANASRHSNAIPNGVPKGRPESSKTARRGKLGSYSKNVKLNRDKDETDLDSSDESESDSSSDTDPESIKSYFHKSDGNEPGRKSGSDESKHKLGSNVSKHKSGSDEWKHKLGSNVSKHESGSDESSSESETESSDDSGSDMSKMDTPKIDINYLQHLQEIIDKDSDEEPETDREQKKCPETEKDTKTAEDEISEQVEMLDINKEESKQDEKSVQKDSEREKPKLAEIIRETYEKEDFLKEDESDSGASEGPELGFVQGKKVCFTEKSKLLELIQNVKDLFPHFGDGFVVTCLQYYDFDSAKVINAILEDILPEEIKSVNQDLALVLPDGFERGSTLDQMQNRSMKGLKHSRMDDANMMDMLDDKTHLKEVAHIYKQYGLTDINADLEYNDEYDDTFDNKSFNVKIRDDGGIESFPVDDDETKDKSKVNPFHDEENKKVEHSKTTRNVEEKKKVKKVEWSKKETKGKDKIGTKSDKQYDYTEEDKKQESEEHSDDEKAEQATSGRKPLDFYENPEDVRARLQQKRDTKSRVYYSRTFSRSENQEKPGPSSKGKDSRDRRYKSTHKQYTSNHNRRNLSERKHRF